MGMPSFPQRWRWVVTRQPRTADAPLLTWRSGLRVTFWAFGWCLNYSLLQGKYPLAAEPRFRPLRDFWAMVRGRRCAGCGCSGSRWPWRGPCTCRWRCALSSGDGRCCELATYSILMQEWSCPARDAVRRAVEVERAKLAPGVAEALAEYAAAAEAWMDAFRLEDLDASLAGRAAAGERAQVAVQALLEAAAEGLVASAVEQVLLGLRDQED